MAVQAQNELRSFEGTSLLRLNGAAVIRRLEAMPTVSSAAYDRDFPHTLRVRGGCFSYVLCGLSLIAVPLLGWGPQQPNFDENRQIFM